MFDPEKDTSAKDELNHKLLQETSSVDAWLMLSQDHYKDSQADVTARH